MRSASFAAGTGRPHHPGSLNAMRIGLIGAALCVAGGLCMLAGLAVDLDSTGAKVLMVTAAALFVPGALVTYGWMRARVPPR